MSFIYNQETLSILSKAMEKTAQESTLNKPATQEQINQVAKKLVNKLSGELSGISSDTPNGAGLKLENLQSLGKLLQFIDENKIKFNNTQIAYNQSEFQGLPDNIKNTLSPISINISRDAFTRQWNQADYYTNLNALVGYVGYLQEKSNENPVLKVMVGKLIDQINQIKPDSGLSRKPKSIPGQPNELTDNTVVDNFGSKVFDIKNPLQDQGAIQLSAKDLRSKESLNSWLQQNPEAQIATYDDKNQRTILKYTDPKLDLNKAFNDIANILQLRANRYSQLSKSPEDSKKFNFYINKVKDFAPTADSNIQKSPDQKSDQSNQNKDKNEQSANSNASQSLNQALSYLPLSIREINLDDIESFFRLVEPIFTGERASRLQAYIADAENKISALKRMMQFNDAIYPLGVAPKQFASRLKQPTVSYLPALSRLSEIVDLTRQVMAEVFSAYGRQMNQNQAAILLGQIGRNRTDNSVYSRNIQDLNELKAGVNQVVKVV